MEPEPVGDFSVKELSAATWGDFEDLFSRGSGWDFCACMYWQRPGHLSRKDYPTRADHRMVNREAKRGLVDEGRAHGILVYKEGMAVGWCQYGDTAELPGARHLTSEPEPESHEHPRTWHITCFVTDKRHRRQGIAAAALRGSLASIRGQGGGVVEAYPIAFGDGAVTGLGTVKPPRGTFGNVSSTGTVSMFEAEGFQAVRALSSGRVLMRTTLSSP